MAPCERLGSIGGQQGMEEAVDRTGEKNPDETIMHTIQSITEKMIR
jgi:hypothetical protein